MNDINSARSFSYFFCVKCILCVCFVFFVLVKKKNLFYTSLCSSVNKLSCVRATGYLFLK
jgi:hypothetical protein